jgi:uncharacterized protein YgiM (DUF1202 family)
MKTILSLAVLLVNFAGWFGIYEVGKSIVTGTPWVPLGGVKNSVSASVPVPVETILKAAVNVDALNMREGPSANDSIVEAVHRGDIIIVLEKNGDSNWVKVEHNGKTGYVYGDYITIEEEE